MEDVTLDVSVLPNANPATPPDGWALTLGSVTTRINTGLLLPVGGETYGGWTLQTEAEPDAGGDISVSCVIGGTGFSSWNLLLTLLNSDGNGYGFLYEPYLQRLYRIDGGLNGTLTQIGIYVGGSQADNDLLQLEYSPETGLVRALKNGSSNLSATDTTYNAETFFGGASANGYGQVGIRSITVYNVSSGGGVESINGGNPITVGQSSITAVHAGFTGAITSITTNRAGLTASVIGGDEDSTAFSISGWQEGAEYPLLDSSVTFTFSRDGESASGSQTVTKPDGWAQVTFSGADIANERYFGKAIDEAGQTVEGSTLYYDTASLPGLVINPDTSGEPLENGGSFDAQLRDVSTGFMHYWRITIAESGDIVDARGITAREITASKITLKSITVRGI